MNRYRPPGSKHPDDVPDGISALEARLPRIADRVCALWNSAEFEAFVAYLMMDSRDGTRQGLPWDVAQELLFLNQLSIAKRAIVASTTTGVPFVQVFRSMSLNAEEAAKNPGKHWTNPNLTGDSRSGRIAESAPIPPRVALRKRKNWWQRLRGR